MQYQPFKIYKLENFHGQDGYVVMGSGTRGIFGTIIEEKHIIKDPKQVIQKPMINLKEVIHKFQRVEGGRRLQARIQRLNAFEIRKKMRFQECRWEPELTASVAKIISLLYMDLKGIEPDIKDPAKQVEEMKKEDDKLEELLKHGVVLK